MVRCVDVSRQKNRLHNAGAAKQWDRRLPGELPDTHVFRFLVRIVKKGFSCGQLARPRRSENARRANLSAST